MSDHSSIVGGSTVERLINCPGSMRLVNDLPPTANIESEYAREGTSMHEVMASLMRLVQMGNDWDMLAVASGDLIGEVFVDRELTLDHVATMIDPAIDQLDNLLDAHGGRAAFRVMGVERRVRFPGIPGAFGTCDLVLCSDTHIVLVDWKFGQGVGVRAIYTDELGDYINGQLLFYAAAALNTVPKLFRRRKIVVAIVQPRSVEPLTYTEINRKEITHFRHAVETAVVMAAGRDAPLKKGEHCRWCPAKITCPLWTKAMFDLALIQPEARVQAKKERTDYADYLARAKALVDLLAMFKAEIDSQLHAYLEAGGTVPGWRLKYKAKQRQWIEKQTVYDRLRELGFHSDDIFETKLRTFAQTDATAKRLGVKIPDELRIAPASTETTIAPLDDPAPVVDRQLTIEQFKDALKIISKRG